MFLIRCHLEQKSTKEKESNNIIFYSDMAQDLVFFALRMYQLNIPRVLKNV